MKLKLIATLPTPSWMQGGGPNVPLKPGFTQVCVWPGTLVGPDRIEDFVNFMKEEFGVEVQYLEEIKTKPDPGRPGTGGRNDLFFAVKDSDIGKFAVPRLQYGIRWIEDVYSKMNHGSHLYPERIKKYRSWDPDKREKK